MSYRVGKLFGRYWPLVAIATVVLLAWLVNTVKPSDQKAALSSEFASVKKAPTPRETCLETMANVLSAYDAHMAAGRHIEAAKSLDHCVYHTNSSELIEKRRLARVEVAWTDAHSKTSTDEDRLQALNQLAALDPERAQKAANVRKSVETRIAKQRAAEKRAEAARKKSEGVRLGMTREDVVASSWGAPSESTRLPRSTALVSSGCTASGTTFTSKTAC